LISDVEIISILILFFASTENILDAIPECERMPIPTTLTFAIFWSLTTSPTPSFFALELTTLSAF